MKNKKIFIIGSHGYLGSRLIDFLLENGYECSGDDIGFFKNGVIYEPIYYPVINKEARTIDEYVALEIKYLEFLKVYIVDVFEVDFRSIKSFLYGINDFNWKRLHESEIEEKKTYGEFLNDFYYEWFYIYDRISYSRMLRAHWLWLVFSNKFFQNLNDLKGFTIIDDDYYDLILHRLRNLKVKQNLSFYYYQDNYDSYIPTNVPSH